MAAGTLQQARMQPAQPMREQGKVRFFVRVTAAHRWKASGRPSGVLVRQAAESSDRRFLKRSDMHIQRHQLASCIAPELARPSRWGFLCSLSASAALHERLHPVKPRRRHSCLKASACDHVVPSPHAVWPGRASKVRFFVLRRTTWQWLRGQRARLPSEMLTGHNASRPQGRAKVWKFVSCPGPAAACRHIESFSRACAR